MITNKPSSFANSPQYWFLLVLSCCTAFADTQVFPTINSQGFVTVPSACIPNPFDGFASVYYGWRTFSGTFPDRSSVVNTGSGGQVCDLVLNGSATMEKGYSNNAAQTPDGPYWVEITFDGSYFLPDWDGGPRVIYWTAVRSGGVWSTPNQTAYSDYCRTAEIDNTIGNIYCFGGQQLFNTSPGPVPNTFPLSGQLDQLTLRLARNNTSINGSNDNQFHSLGGTSVFYKKNTSSIYCYVGGQNQLLADGNWHDVTFNLATSIDGNTLTHTSNCDVNFSTEKLEYIQLNNASVVGAWTDNNIYTDGISKQNNSFSSPNHSLYFTISTHPSPFVIVVPGFGASALTDSFNANQWLSCTSIYGLSNGFVNVLQYSANGVPALPLSPTELLTQSDSINDAVKSSSQSVIQCSTQELITDVACTTPWYNCAEASVPLVPRKTIQTHIVSGANGGLLQFNDLLASLSQAGYSPANPQDAAWPYDFRRDISALANDLYNDVKRVSTANPGRPAAIVTHSMGSLVTAAMIQQHPDISGLLTNVISIGAPFAGAIDTYLEVQGGKTFAPFLSATNTKALSQNWPSVYELLPQWDFVSRLKSPFPTKYDIFNGLSDPTHFPQLPRSSIVPDLNDSASLWSRIGNLGPLPYWYAIIGQGQSTPNQIVEVSNTTTSKPCLMVTEDGSGDGTVPLRSSQAGNIVPTENRIYVNDTHAHMPQNPAVISGVMNVLSGRSPFTISGLAATPSQSVLQDWMTINACSPVNVTIKDSSNNLLNTQVSQIPNGTVRTIGDVTQIDLPWTDTYQVQVTGSGVGTFDLVVNGLGGQHSPLGYSFKSVPVQKGSQGTVMVGGNFTPSLLYNYAGKSVDTIPANTTPPTILCTGAYFTTQAVRATLAFNVGYQGGLSTFSYNFRTPTQTVQFASTGTSQISVNGNSATFSGQGTLNGTAGYTFTVTAKDGGNAGSGLDTVSIAITGPNNYSYTVNSIIVGGDIVVHQ